MSAIFMLNVFDSTIHPQRVYSASPLHFERHVVATVPSSSLSSKPPAQIKATVVISTRGAGGSQEDGGAGRMRWSLARKRLPEWSYVLDRRPSSRIEECDALLSGPRW